MGGEFLTLQEFMLHTKGVVYLLMIVVLLGFTGFWFFVTGRDKEE